MTEDKMRAKINVLANRLLKDRDKARTKTGEEFAELMLLGLELLGEVFIDIKRIADAAERESQR